MDYFRSLAEGKLESKDETIVDYLSNKKYTESRLKDRVGGYPLSVSLYEHLIRSSLSDSEKTELFTSQYDFLRPIEDFNNTKKVDLERAVGGKDNSVRQALKLLQSILGIEGLKLQNLKGQSKKDIFGLIWTIARVREEHSLIQANTFLKWPTLSKASYLFLSKYHKKPGNPKSSQIYSLLAYDDLLARISIGIPCGERFEGLLDFIPYIDKKVMEVTAHTHSFVRNSTESEVEELLIWITGIISKEERDLATKVLNLDKAHNAIELCFLNLSLLPMHHRSLALENTLILAKERLPKINRAPLNSLCKYQGLVDTNDFKVIEGIIRECLVVTSTEMTLKTRELLCDTKWYNLFMELYGLNRLYSLDPQPLRPESRLVWIFLIYTESTSETIIPKNLMGDTHNDTKRVFNSLQDCLLSNSPSNLPYLEYLYTRFEVISHLAFAKIDEYITEQKISLSISFIANLAAKNVEYYEDPSFLQKMNEIKRVLSRQ